MENREASSSNSKLFRDEIWKHRSCWKHVAATSRGCQSEVTAEEMTEIGQKFEHTSPCFFDIHHCRARSPRLRAKTLSLQKKMDSNTFEQCLESLWRNFSEQRRTSFVHLDSLWFWLYLKSSSKEKVLSWIKKRCIFSKKYVFIPILCWSHWSLLIFCHFGEDLYSETRKPCMLLLDSLETANPRRNEPEIRKFVSDIYRVQGIMEKQGISKIPLLVPEVPQQKNKECGNFVLYYINLFMQEAPETFSVSKGYPYFMTKKWFTYESFELFCKKLEKQTRIWETNISKMLPQELDYEDDDDGVVVLN